MRTLAPLLALTLACGEPDPDPVDPTPDPDLPDPDPDPDEPADARLADLRIDGVDLRPSPFNPDHFTYTATVAASAHQVTVRTTPIQPDAVIAVDGTPTTGSVATPLDFGRNTILVEVTDRDGGQATYTLTLTRPAEGDLTLAVDAAPSTWEAGDDRIVFVRAAVDASRGATVDSVRLLSGDLIAADTPIFDDGEAPDEVAGDGIYTGQVHVGGETEGGTYRIRVRAEGRDTLDGILRVTEGVDITIAQEYDLRVSTASFTSIAGTGTRLFTSGSAAVTLPFDVGLFGEILPAGSTIHPDETGQVHVGTYRGGIVPGPLSRYRELVSQMWAVYHHSTARVASGGVYQAVVGEAPNRELVLEWQGRYLSGEGTLQTQLRLREGSSTFEIRYGTMTDDLFDPTRWSQFAFSGDREIVYTVPHGSRVSTLNNRRFLYEW